MQVPPIGSIRQRVDKRNPRNHLPPLPPFLPRWNGHLPPHLGPNTSTRDHPDPQPVPKDERPFRRVLGTPRFGCVPKFPRGSNRIVHAPLRVPDDASVELASVGKVEQAGDPRV